MLKIFQKAVNSLKKKRTASFEECMHTLSTHIAQSSQSLSPKSAFKENIMVINSRACTACIIDSQGDVKYADLSNDRGGYAGNITARDYLLDFFKSIGNRNNETGVIKFQLELIPKGETLGGLINDQLHENLCIISYWGKSTKEIQRIGEITNAFVLGRFEENITSKDELVNFIISKLNQGESALNGTKLESVDKEVIDGHVSSLEPLGNLIPITFYKDWFIEIMRRYESDLKSNF